MFWLALTLTPSPGKSGKPLCGSGFANDCPANPVAVFPGRRRTILLLLGEGPDERGRETFSKAKTHGRGNGVAATRQSAAVWDLVSGGLRPSLASARRSRRAATRRGRTRRTLHRQTFAGRTEKFWHINARKAYHLKSKMAAPLLRH